MVHSLLLLSLVLFALWALGLGGMWAAHTAWMIFVAACAVVVVWAMASLFVDRQRRRMV
jgi:hypothetical protein